MVDMMGLVLPTAYIAVLVGTLATFSSLYRKRKAAQANTLAPWFPPHLQRNVYLTLLHLDSSDEKPAIPDSVLRAALLRRAIEDISRILSLRAAKQAITQLLQRGSIGDELHQRFARAEAEMEEELRDVVLEANALHHGWGQTIFQSASEMTANAQLKVQVEEIQSRAKSERNAWDARRAQIQAEFMKELEGGQQAGAGGGSEDDAVLVESGGPAAGGGKGTMKKKKGKK
ncbi:MAG: translocation protein S66 [Trizodia sp. TS-e1964]|nr:MAG: translocation protein S66 [Trizodia sp. TS-e1964]